MVKWCLFIITERKDDSMNTKTLVANGINYSKFMKRYGYSLNTKILDIIIALDYIDNISVSKEEALNLQRTLGGSLYQKSGITKLLNFVIQKLNNSYTELEPFVELNFNYKCLTNFVLYELQFRQTITNSQRLEILQYIDHYDLKSSWQNKLFTVISYSPDDMTCLGLGLTPDQLKATIDILYNNISFKNKLELDQTFIWHLIGLLDRNGGYV